MKPARVIMADCPWTYNDRKEYRKDNPTRKAKSGVGASGKYSKGCMSLSDLCQLGSLVREISAADAYLFQWVTGPLLPQGLTVMEAWGFRYVQHAFSWIKTYPKSGELFRGIGRYVPSNEEIVLLGVRGAPWHPNTGWKPTQQVICPHPRDRMTGKIIHSRKPDDIQNRIDQWLRPYAGDYAFLELFATRQRPDNPPWTCLGFDVTGRDIRDDLRAYRESLEGQGLLV